VVTALDLRSSGPRLGCHPLCCEQATGTHMLPSPNSITWYQLKLGGKQAHHATHSLCIHGPADLAGVWLRAEESEVSAALLAIDSELRL